MNLFWENKCIKLFLDIDIDFLSEENQYIIKNINENYNNDLSVLNELIISFINYLYDNVYLKRKLIFDLCSTVDNINFDDFEHEKKKIIIIFFKAQLITNVSVTKSNNLINILIMYFLII